MSGEGHRFRRHDGPEESRRDFRSVAGVWSPPEADGTTGSLGEKRPAPRRVRGKDAAMPSFAWQEGYGAFTVGATQRDAVRH
ncbi:MAG: hypothetical protein ABL994_12970, partial [Verrucomicrobiales bacterium]